MTAGAEEGACECYICADTTVAAWPSPCLCTDRFIHEACQRKLLANRWQNVGLACPACAAPFTNVSVVPTRRRFDPKSPTFLLWSLGCLIVVLSSGAIAVNDVLYQQEAASREGRAALFVCALVFGTIAMALSGIWASYLVQTGGRALCAPCTVVGHDLVLADPTRTSAA